MIGVASRQFLYWNTHVEPNEVYGILDVIIALKNRCFPIHIYHVPGSIFLTKNFTRNLFIINNAFVQLQRLWFQ